jgi:hypothetical protein
VRRDLDALASHVACASHLKPFLCASLLYIDTHIMPMTLRPSAVDALQTLEAKLPVVALQFLQEALTRISAANGELLVKPRSVKEFVGYVSRLKDLSQVFPVIEELSDVRGARRVCPELFLERDGAAGDAADVGGAGVARQRACGQGGDGGAREFEKCDVPSAPPPPQSADGVQAEFYKETSVTTFARLLESEVAVLTEATAGVAKTIEGSILFDPKSRSHDCFQYIEVMRLEVGDLEKQLSELRAYEEVGPCV